ncbi:MAG: DoxX family protein [Nibricoccus sp.]
MNTETASPRTETNQQPKKSFMRFIPACARILLGLPLVIFGLNGFFNFIPPPPTPLPEKAMAFAGALMESGYMLQLIGATMLISGVLLLINRFVPLALLLMAPFFVNSLAFHLCLERSGLPMAVIFLALELYLAWVYRKTYQPLFVARPAR